MFCKHCGKELNDQAVICPHCGVQVGNFINPNQDNTNNGNKSDNILAIVGFVFAFLVPIVGLICSILGYKQAKNGAPYKNLDYSGIIVSAVALGLEVLSVFIVYFYFIIFLGLFI